MKNTDQIQQHIKNLLSNQKLAILATSDDGQPYTSLVAFVASDDIKHIFFVTPTSTRKFANLKKDCRVSVLVNSSTNQASDFHEAISVTIIGGAEVITTSKREIYLKNYLAKHPYLEDFAKSPTCALVRVTAKSFFLVKNFQRVMELHLTDEIDHTSLNG